MLHKLQKSPFSFSFVRTDAVESDFDFIITAIPPITIS